MSPHLDASQPAEGRSRVRWELVQMPEFLVAAFLVLLCAGLTLLQSDFATKINFQIIGRQSSVLLVLAAGILFVLLVGGIDLSVGGQIAFAAVLAATVSNHSSPAVGFLVAVVATTGVGIANGFLIGLVGLSPIVITLAAGQILTGAALLLTQTGPVQPTSLHYSDLATSQFGPIPTIVIAAAACLVAGHIVLRHTQLGRYIYATGGSETAAWLAGVPTAKVKLAAYAICGTFAGLAGILASSRIGSGDASLGQAELLQAYAAAFIGGVGFGTARGRVIGVAIGAIVLGVLGNGIDLLGLNTDWQYIVSGSLIVLAIGFQTLPGRIRWRRQP